MPGYFDSLAESIRGPSMLGVGPTLKPAVKTKAGLDAILLGRPADYIRPPIPEGWDRPVESESRLAEIRALPLFTDTPRPPDESAEDAAAELEVLSRQVAHKAVEFGRYIPEDVVRLAELEAIVGRPTRSGSMFYQDDGYDPYAEEGVSREEETLMGGLPVDKR